MAKKIVHLPFNKNGYEDIRNGRFYTDVYCEAKDAKYFKLL